MWVDDEYLERKERRTAIQDRREIIPKCVITVRELLYWQLHNYTVPFTHCRRLGRGTLAPIGTIDRSTFEAETDYPSDMENESTPTE